MGIIGAGIAGLAAARRLAESGVSVEVFDKGRGAGGRASTRRVDLAGNAVSFDHGAQYFTARDERFIPVVERWQHEGVCAAWDAVIGTVDEPGKALPKPDGPTRFVGTPGMNAIVAAMASDVVVRYSTTVDRIERSEGAWLVHLSDGEAARYDALVVATPAPQSVALLQGLPKLAGRAQACEMRPCWAVMAAFDDRLPIEADGVFINLNGHPLSWAARDSNKPGRPAGERWVLHAGPRWSEANIELERENVVNALLPALGEALQIDLPAPEHAAAHRWRYAQTQAQVNGGCMLDARARLAVAGDWCHGGRVEGAFLSGLSASDRLLASLDT